jgi:hypothetical protein
MLNCYQRLQWVFATAGSSTPNKGHLSVARLGALWYHSTCLPQCIVTYGNDVSWG